jgi:O-antigen/teichoic acid export membrane protein
LVVDVIAPNSYAPAATIVPLIALGYGLNGLYILMVTGMGVAKKTGPMFWIVGGAAAANLGINILLIPVWGMRAAAWTTVLANAIMIAGGWYYSQKVYRIPYDWPRIARVTVIGAVIVSACVWLAPGRGLGGIAAATLAWLAFVALLIRTRTLPANEIWRARDQLRGWWPEWRKRFARAGLAP